MRRGISSEIMSHRINTKTRCDYNIISPLSPNVVLAGDSNESIDWWTMFMMKHYKFSSFYGGIKNYNTSILSNFLLLSSVHSMHNYNNTLTFPFFFVSSAQVFQLLFANQSQWNYGMRHVVWVKGMTRGKGCGTGRSSNTTLSFQVVSAVRRRHTGPDDSGLNLREGVR